MEMSSVNERSSSELDWTDAQTNAILPNLSNLSDMADLTFELGLIAGSTQWTLDHRFSSVDWGVGGGTDVERIVLVVLQLVGVRRCLLASGQDLSGLLRNVWLRSEFQETRCERRGRLEVLEFEEQVQSGSQSQDQVDRLEITMGKVGGHLTDAFLFVQRVLW